jgi:hypothetical protein
MPRESPDAPEGLLKERRCQAAFGERDSRLGSRANYGVKVAAAGAANPSAQPRRNPLLERSSAGAFGAVAKDIFCGKADPRFQRPSMKLAPLHPVGGDEDRPLLGVSAEASAPDEVGELLL